MSHQPALAVVVPPHDEEAHLAATVEAARTVPGIDLVVVVDDGSSDATAAVARAPGARIARHGRRWGKAAAMETGADLVARADRDDGRRAPRALLLLDADLGSSAATAAPLAVPVLDGRADMTIALLPPSARPGGGHGFVVGLARRGTEDRTGWRPSQPLSGQRCLTRAAFERLRPLARRRPALRLLR